MAFQESGKKIDSKKKLNWNRLTRNLCPACSSRKTLKFLNGLPGLRCGDDCGFMINEQRMEEIVRDILEDQGRDDEWEEWGQLCGGCGKPDPICSCFND